MGEATGRDWPLPYELRLRFGGMLLRGRDLLSIADLTPEELRRVLDTAHALKGGEGGRPTAPTALGQRGLLAGKVLALVFEKPSLRTRVSFDVGMRQLGGEGLYPSPPQARLVNPD